MMHTLTTRLTKIAFFTLGLLLVISCKNSNNTKSENKTDANKVNTTNNVQLVAEFNGQQVTGVSVSNTGRVFANFPRWRKNVANSVIEVLSDTKQKGYPDNLWNSWEIGQPIAENKFIGVQSVVAFEDKLYVLDTRSKLFENVLDAPRVFVFSLDTNTLVRTYILTANSYHPDSYINDLRIDKKNNKIYFTDSGHAGLVILDITTGESRRVLDNHTSTTAEVSSLTFGDKKWSNTIHSDGIALNLQNNRLYYHALTGYSLYSIATKDLLELKEAALEKAVQFEAKTAAPDGMIFDALGTLYFADLENHKIKYRKPEGTIRTLIEGDAIKWADTFSIYKNYLYFTNSRLHEITPDISNMVFTIHKIKLPVF